MGREMGDAGAHASLPDVESQLARTVDRLRSLPLDRLGRPGTDGLSPADRAHQLCRHFVCLTHGEGRAAPGGPGAEAPPELPRLADRAAADQLQVVVGEFLKSVESDPNSQADDFEPADVDLADAVRRLLDLRLSI